MLAVEMEIHQDMIYPMQWVDISGRPLMPTLQLLNIGMRKCRRVMKTTQVSMSIMNFSSLGIRIRCNS